MKVINYYRELTKAGVNAFPEGDTLLYMAPLLDSKQNRVEWKLLRLDPERYNNSTGSFKRHIKAIEGFLNDLVYYCMWH